MKNLVSIIVLLVAVLFSINSFADIKTENFRVISAPAVAKSTAAYGIIKNAGVTADTLIDVSSNAAIVMLHKTEIDSGMARMVHMPNIVIAPGSQLVLEPMSFHLMLSGMSAEKLKEGKSITLVFEFEKAGLVEVGVPVVSAWD